MGDPIYVKSVPKGMRPKYFEIPCSGGDGVLWNCPALVVSQSLQPPREYFVRMQTRSRTTATTLIQITQVLKPKKESTTRIRKTVKRTIATSTTTVSAPPAEDGHPLDVRTPPPNRKLIPRKKLN